MITAGSAPEPRRFLTWEIFFVLFRKQQQRQREHHKENKQTNKVSKNVKTNQAVLKEVPPHTARELGEAEAECEKEGQPEVVGGHLAGK